MTLASISPCVLTIAVLFACQPASAQDGQEDDNGAQRPDLRRIIDPHQRPELPTQDELQALRQEFIRQNARTQELRMQRAREERAARMESLLPPRELLSLHTIPTVLLERLDALDSASFAERENALEEIRSDQSIQRIDLYAALAQLDLSPEQRRRLLTVVRSRIFAPRGALGITMQTFGIGDDFVVVTDLTPGFPANDVLEFDDRITHVDGTQLTAEGFGAVEQLRFLVQAKQPGDTVSLTVLRRNRDINANGERILVFSEPIQVEITLASFEDLAARSANVKQTGEDNVVRAREHQWRQAQEAFGGEPTTIRRLALNSKAAQNSRVR